jgi:putative SOS response-associated peptidase YedK
MSLIFLMDGFSKSCNFIAYSKIMCGRFSLTVNEAELNERFLLSGGIGPYEARYNCAPTQMLAVITNTNRNHISYFRWGLIPSWAKDVKLGAKMINARAETILEKASFRNAFSRRRCLIPATSFFEWKQEKDKTPYVIKLVGGEIFSMAGIWEEWKGPEGIVVNSFSIITSEANNAMQPLHHRMPVILSKQIENVWLSDFPPGELIKLLQPCPDEWLEIYPVSNLVNSPKNDVPEILIPVSAGQS